MRAYNTHVLPVPPYEKGFPMTIPHCQRMVRGGHCVIIGGGSGLCSHGMDAGRLHRPDIRQHRQVDPFSIIVQISILNCKNTREGRTNYF